MRGDEGTARDRLKALARLDARGRSAEHPLRLMEVCGTHTMAIAAAGLRGLLPPWVKLISGPGCPVCVTDAGALDELLRLSMLPGVVIASYGDLLRVPGSRRGDTLAARRAAGARVQVVYSAMDAVELAAQNPQDQVIFLGVGFETTAPGTAVCILEAQQRGLENFSVLSLLKVTPPAVRAVLAGGGPGDPGVDGFLCPGHVATVIGADAFGFLPREYGVPAVVAGFEPPDLVQAVCDLCTLWSAGTPGLVNDYPRAVRPGGNPAALAAMQQVFALRDDDWRGLGRIPASGLAVRPAYAAFDAAVRFGFAPKPAPRQGGCRCGEVLRGLLEPQRCPLFGAVCTPADPVGPCMVSGEGSCAAAYKYRGV